MAIVTFYNCDPKDAPKTTMPAHLGANAILTWQGKLLLEKRRDSDIWGLVGGGCKKWETGRQAIARESWEELGVRIAAFRDGSIWRMVIVVYVYEFAQEPQLRISSESKELRFFSPEEIAGIEIAVTHADIVADWFQSGAFQKRME